MGSEYVTIHDINNATQILPVTGNDHLMTLDEFQAGIEDGCLTDYDGYAMPTSLSDGTRYKWWYEIHPSKFVEERSEWEKRGLTHVVWVNR